MFLQGASQFIKENYLNKKNYFLIIKNFGNTSKEIKNNIINFSKKFGKILGQNKLNKKFIEITPDIKKLKKKISNKKINLRYHQTNKGGSIHTDGPQHENTPKFVFMAFINNENKGGETILVNGKKLFDFIKKKKPSFSNSLQKNFYFERRGFKFDNKNIFKKKIFDNKNNFSMRYLREYIDTAYKKLNKKMMSEKMYKP